MLFLGVGLMRRLIFLIVLGGCVTPTIPIPPPDPAKMDFQVTVTGTESTAVFQYPPTTSYKGGISYLYNRALGQGLIWACNPDGSIGPTGPLTAHVGDEIVVSVQVNDQTDSSCIVLRNGAQDPTQYCQ